MYSLHQASLRQPYQLLRRPILQSNLQYPQGLYYFHQQMKLLLVSNVYVIHLSVDIMPL